MGYPTRLLNDDEHVALDLRPHWWFFSKHIVGGAVLLVLFVFTFGWEGTLGSVSKWVLGLGLLAYAVWLGIEYVQWRLTNFVVTSQRVIYRTGVLRRHGVEIPLTRINNIIFEQRWFERLIGAGDLVIESAGERGQSRFTDVQQPDAVQQEIYRRMEAEQRRHASFGREAAPPPAAPAAPDAAEQIRKLAELRDAGAITQAEYDAKKAELLDRM
jgi:uncharacterized membrane protein YdbT with pleckstrin-like domain